MHSVLYLGDLVEESRFKFRGEILLDESIKHHFYLLFGLPSSDRICNCNEQEPKLHLGTREL